MPRRDVSSQQRQDVAVLALGGYPRLVFILGHDAELHLHVHLVGGEQQFLQYVAAACAVGHHQHTHRKGVVYVGLAYVQYRGVMVGQYAGQLGRDAGPVRPGYVYQYQLAVRFLFVFTHGVFSL